MAKFEKLEDAQNQNDWAERAATKKFREESLNNLALIPARSAESKSANEILASTKFSIDFGSVVQAVDRNGYVRSHVSNALRSQMGSKADEVIAAAQMAHATTMAEELNPEQNLDNHPQISHAA